MSYQQHDWKKCNAFFKVTELGLGRPSLCPVPGVATALLSDLAPALCSHLLPVLLTQNTRWVGGKTPEILRWELIWSRTALELHHVVADLIDRTSCKK